MLITSILKTLQCLKMYIFLPAFLRRKKKPLLISLFFFFFSFISHPQDLEFENINSNHGLSHSTVYAITEDDHGFLWFGTREGLNRFDGYNLTTFYRPERREDFPGLKDNEINCLLPSGSDIFVGTQKGLSKFSLISNSFSSDFSGMEINEPITVLSTQDEEEIIAGTTNGFYIIKDNTLTKVLSHVNVRGILQEKGNRYWLALTKRIVLIDSTGKEHKSYRLQKSEEAIRNMRINTLFRDSHDKIWLGTSNGLYSYSPQEDQFVINNPLTEKNHHQIEAKVIRTIAEDKNKNLWLGTEDGIFIFTPETHHLRRYSHSFTSDKNSLSDKSIHSLYSARDGKMWVGTYFGGVNFTVPEGYGFRKLKAGGIESNSLSGKAVSQIIKVEKELWIATEDGGVSIYNPESEKFSYLNTSHGLTSNNIHALYADNKENIWVGTFLGGLNKVDKKTRKIKSFKNEPEKKGTISNNYIYAILQDSKEKLWIGTQQGLNVFDYKSNTFQLFKPDQLKDKFIYDLLEDKNGNLWICTRFSGIYRYNPLEDKLEHFSAEKELSSNNIISAREFSNGNIWFGTLNGGMIEWNSKKNTFNHYTKANGLVNNNVYEVIEADDKSIWFTTNQGLTNFIPSQTVFKNFSAKDGLPTNQFNFKSAFKDENGFLYFGSINGLTFFHPEHLNFDIPTPNIEFTGFKLFNKEVPVSREGILEKDINYTDSITLKSNQNVITFEFSAFNYPIERNYAYYLEGFEESWNKVGDKHTATYTNLSPGEYTFKVHTLPHGEINQRSIHLKILPPFWKTNWAYGVYGLILMFLLIGIIRLVRFVNQQRLAVRLEKFEKEKIKEVNQHKLNFFTFISHEFKTPLTIILASLEKYLQQNSSYSKPSKELIQIKKFAGRLQHLVEQLMEFRKTENPHTQPEYKKGDIILFLKDTFLAFTLLINEKEINFSLKSDLSQYSCYFDPNKLEMIVTNLISNAIKSTPEKGEINVNIGISNDPNSCNPAWLILTIKDSGCGMAPETVAKVFDPFFKGENHSSSYWQKGSGIGLALVKSLCSLLEGKIDFSSKEKEGTKVTVSIPLKLEVEKEKIYGTIVGNKEIKINPDLVLEESRIKDDFVNTKISTLMIVDDNKEIIKFLQEHFSQKYKIVTAKNGINALQKIKNHLPDIIISDLVMEEMDGISLCKKIRSSPTTSHIPFLLLTGREDKTSKLEGLRVGANAFIKKPFSLGELDLIVKNLLETNHKRIKRFVGIEIKNLKTFPRNNQNEEFLRKINHLVQENYKDPKFNIETLAQLMGISRSLLHLKMKKATSSSASDYLKKIRLQKAEELIKEGKNISEVAYQTGYNDPNYFSRVFKKEYKVSPSEFKRKSELEIQN